MMGGGRRKLLARMEGRGWCLAIIFKTVNEFFGVGIGNLGSSKPGEILLCVYTSLLSTLHFVVSGPWDEHCTFFYDGDLQFGI